MEQRIGELETNKRELADNLRKVLDRHETCQHEIHNAVRAREGIMKRYRLLVRVASDLLQVGSRTPYIIYFSPGLHRVLGFSWMIAHSTYSHSLMS